MYEGARETRAYEGECKHVRRVFLYAANDPITFCHFLSFDHAKAVLAVISTQIDDTRHLDFFVRMRRRTRRPYEVDVAECRAVSGSTLSSRATSRFVLLALYCVGRSREPCIGPSTSVDQ